VSVAQWVVTQTCYPPLAWGKIKVYWCEIFPLWGEISHTHKYSKKYKFYFMEYTIELGGIFKIVMI